MCFSKVLNVWPGLHWLGSLFTFLYWLGRCRSTKQARFSQIRKPNVVWFKSHHCYTPACCRLVRLMHSRLLVWVWPRLQNVTRLKLSDVSSNTSQLSTSSSGGQGAAPVIHWSRISQWVRRRGCTGNFSPQLTLRQNQRRSGISIVFNKRSEVLLGPYS